MKQNKTRQKHDSHLYQCYAFAMMSCTVLMRQTVNKLKAYVDGRYILIAYDKFLLAGLP